MRIAIDVRSLMNKNYSGVSNYAFNLLKALFELDHVNQYVLFYNSSKSVSLPDFDYPNVSYFGFHCPNKIFNLTLNLFGWPKLDKLVGGCDIFFAPNLHFVSWSDNCRKVIAVHDLSFLAYPQFFTLKQRLWHKLILNKKILEQADMIIADSMSTKRDLVDLLDIEEEKIKVVYLGDAHVIPTEAEKSILLNTRDPSITAGLPAFSRDDREVRDKCKISDPYFLFVGTIEPRKNLSGIIQAMDNLPSDVKLAVAGDWGWKCGEINKLINLKINKFKNIIFLGYVSEEEKANLYRNAIALVYPSYYEGFGLPIVEAMSLGCPVIAGNNASQGEVLGDAGLLVDPFNMTEISQAMELMLSDYALRQDFINRGKIQAEKFTWNKTAQETLKVFNTLK